MVRYFHYDPDNPRPVVGEQHTITNGMIRLRHTPTENSIMIDGFTAVNSPAALRLNQFACLYSRESGYRESNRIVYFSSAHNGATVLVNYSACGTVVIADDMNEIKQHLDESIQKELLNEASHVQFSNDILALRNAVATLGSNAALDEHNSDRFAHAHIRDSIIAETNARVVADNEVRALIPTFESDAVIENMLNSIFGGNS